MDFSVFIDNGMNPAQIKQMYESENNRRFPNRELEVYITQLNERVHFIENNDREFINNLSNVFSRTSVYRECYKLGLPKLLTTYEVTKPVLWDEFTAYLYGYFVGDGCMHVSRSKNGGQMDIASSDIQIIQDLMKGLNLKKYNVYKKKEYKEVYRIFWTSKEWHQFFLDMGLTVGKSKVDFIPKFPPKEFMNHFIRGVQDSDGYISTYLHRDRLEVTWGLLGGDSFIEELHSFLTKTLEIDITLSRSRKLRQMSISSKKKLKLLYDYLYNDCSICLERKVNKFKEVC